VANETRNDHTQRRSHFSKAACGSGAWEKLPSTNINRANSGFVTDWLSP
jgi:hypothetical protein